MRTLIAALVLVGMAHAAEPCVSGLKIGERPKPYTFHVANGPQRGQLTCYICDTGKKPAMIVFARTLSEPLAKLLSKTEESLKDQPEDGIRAWATVLGEENSLDSLTKWAKDNALQRTPIGVFDEIDGPPSYRLNREADVTVIVFTDEKTTANFAFRAGELTDDAMKQIIEAVGKLRK